MPTLNKRLPEITATPNAEQLRANSTVPRRAVLTARLRLDSAEGERLAINPENSLTHCINEPFGEGNPFMVAPDAVQFESGLAAAIIGAPTVSDRSTGAMLPLNASTLLELYRAQGRACLADLRGAWGLVILDPQQKRVLLAIDRMGRQPLYFRVGRDSVLIGSHLSRLRELAGSTALDEQILYNYLYFHTVPAPGAVVARFHKLAAAQCLELTPGGHDLTHYWTPTFCETTDMTVAGAHSQLRTTLKRAVSRSVAGVGAREKKVGAFLSGGLDSSTVAGLLSERQGGSCDAYAIGFAAEGYDEMAFARVTAKHFGIRLHEHYVTPDEVVAALPDIAAAFDEPFGNSSALPAYFCARMAAADGVEVLLAGDGGDELFAGNERYLRQKVFERYQRAPDWLRAQIIEPLLGRAPDGMPLVGKGRSFVRQANTALPARLQYYSFLEQNNPSDIFMADFLAQVDQAQPLRLLDKLYAAPADASALNRMLVLDWQITLADNDLRKVGQACALAGVEVRYPLLDDELVAFSTRIPSAWKLPGRKLRHFYKEALAGWLPDATIKKSKHGFGLPFGVWMKTHKPLQELAYDNIFNLKERGIFQPGFLDQAVAKHRDEHASYYGELIWVLTALELWLAANQPDYHYAQRDVQHGPRDNANTRQDNHHE